ncbi:MULTISPECIES: LacI family DNA-binding transcriptional regulator [unclassified Paenibacillus]|uniref:LacI family DNA-binding transcriptional regulator n=1 Tax=unclassified Paenibacillus TaxID=185978 RepID=UPI000709F198|nr:MULTISPECIES: LacI family DNA-binding transcriptional regulator [unclassified Paenibacillus]KQX48762.1 LacI family transcriptional regulator [Paenibacillus sp. Root444D2]KRE36380.1 LacI family transcriptional regulator [Paenibacillus sp. Soil724D2]
MANIKDIAKLAGVSVTTVSRVINGHPYVSTIKKEAVRRAMELANYERNINAVHLSKGKTNLIGVVVPSIRRPFFGMVVEGIADEAIKDNYKLVLIQTNYEIEREMDALMMLKLKQIDALIICSKTSDWDIVEEYVRYGPIIVLEDARGRNVSSMFIDHYKSFSRALSYLRSKGHHKIGYCLARKSSPNSEQREAAYRDFYSNLNETFDPNYIFYDCVHLEDGEWIMQRIIKMEDPPTALLVTSDQVAAGILTYCKENDIGVPDKLAIVGFDNQPIAKIMNITTFEIPIVEIGRRLFLQVIDGSHFHEEIPINLIERLTV